MRRNCGSKKKFAFRWTKCDRCNDEVIFEHFYKKHTTTLFEYCLCNKCERIVNTEKKENKMIDKTLSNKDFKVVKTKVASADIIVIGNYKKRPYYGIKYFDLSDREYHIGFGSYMLDNVVKWKDECLDIVEEPLTNADKIRSMTDEQLADWIISHDDKTEQNGRWNKGQILNYMKKPCSDK